MVRPAQETEFAYGGEAHRAPANPRTRSDEQWGYYLFMRRIPRGAHRAMGCMRMAAGGGSTSRRDTVTYKLTAVYKVGERRRKKWAGQRMSAESAA